MFKKKIDLQNVELVMNALEHLTNEFEILENGEVFGGKSQWDALREFVNNEDQYEIPKR
jgi:vacuolar-type H+-ATPase subunit C/Vma6